MDADREKRSRSLFAQEAIKVEEVARELQAVRAAIGSSVDVERFTVEAFQAHGATVSRNGDLKFEMKDVPRGLFDAIGEQNRFVARFELPLKHGQIYLSRTQPIVEGLASFVMDTALDPNGGGVARRCGVIRTSRVQKRTTLLLVRLRYHIITHRGRGDKATESPLLAEDCQLLAFTGSPQNAEWLDSKVAEELLLAEPEANIQPDQATHFLRQMLDGFDAIQPHLDEVARQRGEELLDAHRRVRLAARETNVSHRVEPQLPCDVLGVYLYLPKT